MSGVGGEDGSILRAEFGGDGFLVGACLGGGLARAWRRRPHSLSIWIGEDGALRNAEPLGVQHEGWTDGDAGRDSDAAFDFHRLCFSPRQAGG